MSIFSKNKVSKKHNVTMVNHQIINDENEVEQAAFNLFLTDQSLQSYTLLPESHHCFIIDNLENREIATELSNERLNYRLKSLHNFNKTLEQVDLRIDNISSPTDKYLINLLDALTDSFANFKKGIISICASINAYDAATQTATIGIVYSGGKEALKNCLNDILS